MNKSRKTSNLYNVITYDDNGNVVVPASVTLGSAPASDDNSLKVGTTSWIRTYISSLSLASSSSVTTAVADLVAAAPTTLDTLNELAAALGDDANFASTITTSIASKLALSGGTLTGALQVRYDGGTSIDAVLRLRGSNSTARTTRLQFEDYNGTIADAFLDFKIPTVGSSTGARLDLGGDSPILSLVKGGNVGIGTVNPQSGVKLDINGAMAIGGGSEGLRLGNVGDNSAYDNVKLYYTGYNSGSPRVYLTPRQTPGSGVVNTFFHLQNTNDTSTSANNTMGLIVDSAIGVGTIPSYLLDLYTVTSATTGTVLRLKNGYNDPSTGLRMRWDFASLAGAYLDVTTDSGGSKSMTLYLSAANATPTQAFQILGSNKAASFAGSITSSSTVKSKGVVVVGASGGYTTGDNTYINLGGEGTPDNFGAINMPFGDVMKFNSYHGYQFKTSNSTANPVTMFSIGISGAANFSSSITLGGNIMLPGSISSSSQLNFKNVGSEFQLMNFPASNNTITLYGAVDRIYFKTDKSVGNQNILSIGTDSNVGLGTTSPSHKLQVSGNIYSSDTVFGRNLKPEAFVSVNAGTPSAAGIPLGYSTIGISTITDGNWRSVLSNINDVKGFFWVTLGDAASKDTANYMMAMTSPAYGVSNFGVVSYQNNGWNTGEFEFTTDTIGGSYRLLVRCTSYYSGSATAYGTIYFLRME